MKNRVFALVMCALAALLFVAGCAKKTPEEKLVDMVEGYAKILTSNENDCSKAGKEIDAYIDKNKAEFTLAFNDLMTQAKEDKDGKLDKKMEELEAKYKDKFNKDKIEEISKKCESDPDFKKAHEKLGAVIMGVVFSAMAEGMADAFKDAGSDDADDAPAPDAPAGDAPAGVVDNDNGE